MTHVLRTMASTLTEASRRFAVITLTGQSGTGKTTLVQTSGTSRQYLDLSDPTLRQQALENPGAFLQRYPPPVTFDNLHFAPLLFDAVLARAQKSPVAGGYWLVSNRSLTSGRHMTGRHGRILVHSLHLLGLSQAEKEKREGAKTPFLPTVAWIGHARQRAATPSPFGPYPALWRGGLPYFISENQALRESFFEAYIETFVERDLRGKHVVDIEGFRRFLHVAALQTAKAVNYAEMAREVGVNLKTARAWLELIETFGWVYILPPYDDGASRIMVKTPKLYFLDTGLCAFLAGATTPENLETGTISAAIVETHMMLEVLKSYWNLGQSPDFRFYRDRSQKEIDLIIPSGGRLYPVEFRKTMMPRLNATKNFSALEVLELPVGAGGILALHKTDLVLSPTVLAIPISYL